MRLPVLSVPLDRLEARFTDKKPLYSAGEATTEANRCLYCSDAPCIQACPTEIDVPTFIRKISTGNLKGAARTILSANLLGQSCAQVCPVEVLCAGSCVYNQWGREPIAIGRLQRYAVENALAPDATGATPKLFTAKPSTGKRIALIGAGPASIAAAGLLALEGHHCVLLERHALPGGLNSLGIAPYKMKLPDAFRELEWVMSLGRIELQTGAEVTPASADALLRTYDAIFLGLGLGPDTALNLPGEAGPGVHGAVALIERIKSDPTFKLNARRALVVGGGNTALDIAHELVLLGLEVALVYRRGEADMSGYAHELDGARLAGVQLLPHRTPVAIARDAHGQASGLRVTDGTLPNSPQETIPADLIAVAIGQSRATHIALAFPGVQLDARGRVRVDPATHRTGNAKVWSGGDCVNGGMEVVNAVAEAKIAARHINATLIAAPAQAGRTGA